MKYEIGTLFKVNPTEEILKIRNTRKLQAVEYDEFDRYKSQGYFVVIPKEGTILELVDIGTTFLHMKIHGTNSRLFEWIFPEMVEIYNLTLTELTYKNI